MVGVGSYEGVIVGSGEGVAVGSEVGSGVGLKDGVGVGVSVDEGVGLKDAFSSGANSLSLSVEEPATLPDSCFSKERNWLSA